MERKPETPLVLKVPFTKKSFKESCFCCAGSKLTLRKVSKIRTPKFFFISLDCLSYLVSCFKGLKKIFVLQTIFGINPKFYRMDKGYYQPGNSKVLKKRLPLRTKIIAEIG